MLYTMTMSGTYSLGKMAKGLYTKYTIYVYIMSIQVMPDFLPNCYSVTKGLREIPSDYVSEPRVTRVVSN